MQDIVRRLQPSGTAAENAGLACDPEGFAQVPEEAREDVDYPRPAFNWPSSSAPQANFFALEAMAIDTLRHSGFIRESTALRAHLSLNPPPYPLLPALLHRYLDFEPANCDPAKLAALRAMADDMGLDVGFFGNATKKKIANNLHHASKTAKEEWAWLVGHAAETSAFGKTAACELSLPTMLALVALWLPQIGSPDLLPAADASFANLSWFRSAFPMGWSHIDRLGESAVVSAPAPEDFAARLALAYFEMSDKISRGWTETDARRFAFAHKNNLDMNGAALFAMGAHDHFKDHVLPVLSGERAPHGPGAAPLLSQRLQEIHPGLAGEGPNASLWLLYSAIDPDSSRLIQSTLTNPKSSSTSERAAMRARVERMELAAAQASFWSAGPPSALPAAALSQKSAMRL